MAWNVSHGDGSPAGTSTSNHTRPGCRRHWSHVPSGWRAARISSMASAIRWTKQTLNHWYRAQSAILDASLAYEFYGFGGPDAREGLTSHTEKRDPRFSGPTSE